MNKWIALLALAPVLAIADPISGDVFIVTRGKAAVKLPLTPVIIYPLEDALAFIEKRKDDGQRVRDFLKRAKDAPDAMRERFIPGPTEGGQSKEDQIMGMAFYTRSQEWFMSGLPTATASTKSDADGKFAFDVPAGNYAALAFGLREVGSKTENYFWLVKTKTGVKDLHLANDNLAGEGSSESLVEDAIPAPAKAITAMGVRGAKWLIDFVETMEPKAPTASEVEATRKEIVAAKEMSDRESKAMDAKIAADRLAEEQRVEREAKAMKDKMAADQLAEEKRVERADLAKEFGGNTAAAQQEAIRRYPALGVKGSAMNLKFIELHQRYRQTQPEYFSSGEWPIVLAEECAKATGAQ